jgi:hypothetical protein
VNKELEAGSLNCQVRGGQYAGRLTEINRENCREDVYLGSAWTEKKSSWEKKRNMDLGSNSKMMPNSDLQLFLLLCEP